MLKEKETKEKDYTKVTSGGRLYIDTADFFQQEEIQEAILEFLDSELVKGIQKRKEKKQLASAS